MAGTRSDSLRTQAKIVATAERLFAERGIDAVSLSEINRSAGQGNKSAVHYHFGSKMGVLDAIRAKHVAKTTDATEALLAELPVDATIRDVIVVGVRPIASRLDDVEGGGPSYLRMMAQAIPHPNLDVVDRILDTQFTDPQKQLVEMLRARVSYPSTLFDLRLRSATAMLYEALGSRAVAEQAGNAVPDRELFVENLIDALSGVLETVPSTRAAELVA